MSPVTNKSPTSALGPKERAVRVTLQGFTGELHGYRPFLRGKHKGKLCVGLVDRTFGRHGYKELVAELDATCEVVEEYEAAR